jgi:hypothetical protein
VSHSGTVLRPALDAGASATVHPFGSPVYLPFISIPFQNGQQQEQAATLLMKQYLFQALLCIQGTT